MHIYIDLLVSFCFVLLWVFFGPIALFVLYIGLLRQGNSDPHPIKIGGFVLLGAIATLLSFFLFAVMSVGDGFLNVIDQMFALRKLDTIASGSGPSRDWLDRLSVSSEIASVLLLFGTFWMFAARPGSLRAAILAYWVGNRKARENTLVVSITILFFVISHSSMFYSTFLEGFRKLAIILYFPAAALMSLIMGTALILYFTKRDR